MTELPNSSNSADQYAQQWIDFLKKRNSLLSILLLLSVLLCLASGLASFHFYQQSQTAILENTLSKSDQSDLESQLAAQAELIEQSRILTEQMKTENEQLISKHDTQLKEAEMALSVNQEIAENLNAQIALLKEENDALSNSLSQVRESLLSGASNSEILTSENARLTKQIDDLSKKLKDRKVAYLAVVKRQKETQLEIDRLIDSNESLERASNSEALKVGSLQQQVAKLRKDNVSLQSKLDASQKQFKALEDKLVSAMAPIGVQKAPAAAVESKTSFESVSAHTGGLDGLEEIQVQKPLAVVKVKKPLEENSNSGSKKSVSKDSFDYDQISIP